MTRLLALLLCLLPLAAAAQTYRSDEHAFRVVKVVEGLEQPWSVAFLPDGRMLVTEKAGRLRVVQNMKLNPAPLAGIPQVTVHGQGGFFDVVPHPQFAQNQLLYLSYAARGDDGVGTELARGRLAGDRLEGVQVLFRQSPKGSRGQHFGGRIVFDRAGFVYLTLGDRGEMPRAQRPDDHAGSVIRLHDDGRVPQDNPFVGRPGWKPEKFTLGNRNMQGAALHPQTGMLWTHEHGPQGGDEINVIRAGANYGWPVIQANQMMAGMLAPVAFFPTAIAPSGASFARGRAVPQFENNLFVAALRGLHLLRVRIDPAASGRIVVQERLLDQRYGRIRDVVSGPDGFLYFCTNNRDGRGSPGTSDDLVARLVPAL